MRFSILSITFLVLTACVYGVATISKNDSTPQFRHIIVDTVFRSESCTAADIDGDGLLDVVVGDVWYQAPNWEPIEIRQLGQFFPGTDTEKGSLDLPSYSNSFAVQALDANGDDLTDVLIYPVMNQPITCYINPGSDVGHWKSDQVVKRYHGESPLLVDLYNNGQLGALAGVHRSDSLFHLCYMTPTPEGDWLIEDIGHTTQSRYRGPGWDKLTKWFAAGSRDHGLGVGDINGDGRQDVLTRQGWYEAPQGPKQKAWIFHRIPFDSLAAPDYPQYQFAQLPVLDVDGDGDQDFVGSSAHRYGLWWFEQIQTNDRIDFKIHAIPHRISQVHAVAMGDLNNNDRPDIILGKRRLAHNGRDPGWDDPLELIWLEPQPEVDGVSWNMAVVHTGIGVGTQIEVVDIDADGWEDVIVSNKMGTHFFQQIPPK